MSGGISGLGGVVFNPRGDALDAAMDEFEDEDDDEAESDGCDGDDDDDYCGDGVAGPDDNVEDNVDGEEGGARCSGGEESQKDIIPHNIRLSVDLKEGKQLLTRQVGSLQRDTAAKFCADACFKAAYAVRLQTFMRTGAAGRVVIPLASHQDGPPAGYVYIIH